MPLLLNQFVFFFKPKNEKTNTPVPEKPGDWREKMPVHRILLDAGSQHFLAFFFSLSSCLVLV